MLNIDMRKKIETFESLSKLFYLDGDLKLRWVPGLIGRSSSTSVAGSLRKSDKDSYYRRIVCINGITFYASRIVWVLHNKTSIGDGLLIDHKTHDSDELYKGLTVLCDHPSNLRLASSSQNRKNVKIQKNNTSGVKGVIWNKKNKRWVARITNNGNRYHIGCYLSIDDARDAICAKRLEFHGEYARDV